MNERLEFKAALSVDDTGTITGLAWPFGSADRVGDIIQKGAFGKPESLPMLFAHDQAQVIGVWDEITESNEGLTVKGRLLVSDIARAAEVHAMIREKAVTGLSIGFSTKAAIPRAKGRTITALDLVEISIVAVPMHPGAKITSLKSQEESMENENVPANDVPDIDLKAFNDVKTRLDKLEAKSNRPQGVVITGPNTDAETKAFGTMLRQGVTVMSADEIKAMTVATNVSGGFLAPASFDAELLKLLIEYSPIREYAKVVTISAPELIYPRRVASTAAAWVTEIASRPTSEMTFEQVSLKPYELATYTDVSNQLLEDNAYALEGELLSDFAESFGKTEGLAFVKGSGAGQPKGIALTSQVMTEVKTGVAAAFPANPADVLIGMFHKLPNVFAQSAVWMMNRNTLSVIRQWKDTTGNYLVLDPITAAGATTLLGRPIVEMPDMDNIGANALPIIFGDLSGYRIVDRIGLSTMRDPFTLAAVGQVRFHARKRVGGDITHMDRFVRLRVAV